MDTDSAKRPRERPLANGAFVGLTALFGIALLVQIFLAGEAALIAPEDWYWHVTWIHVFQWLSIVLPVAAYAASRRLAFAALNCVPILVIGLQYALIHRAIDQTTAALAGVHAAFGAAMVGFVVFVLQEWRFRR